MTTTSTATTNTLTREDVMLGQWEYHENGGCSYTVGPRGGQRLTLTVWRPNGRIKTWKTRPTHFQLPIKYGFRGPYGYLTQDNLHMFHKRSDCRALAAAQSTPPSTQEVTN